MHEQSFLTDKEGLLSLTDKDAQPFLSPSTSRITPGPESPFTHAVETPGLESRLVHDDKEDNGDKREIYDGLFNARPAALYHDLCVAVRSHIVTPVDSDVDATGDEAEEKSKTKAHYEL